MIEGSAGLRLVDADWGVEFWLSEAVVELVLVGGHEVEHFLFRVLDGEDGGARRGEQITPVDTVSVHTVASA